VVTRNDFTAEMRDGRPCLVHALTHRFEIVELRNIEPTETS
jgi:hypothetical protein